LVALYFAVQDETLHHKDGCVWGLYPYALNLLQVQTNAVLAATNRRVKPLIDAAFDSEASKPEAKVIATMAAETDFRMYVQQSAYTIHSTAESLNDPEPLTDGNGPAPMMYKFIIPAASKEAMKAWLRVAGISRASLFPDLTNLTNDMKERTASDRLRGVDSSNTVQRDLFFDVTDQ